MEPVERLARPAVVVIVPAYDEQETISSVVSVLVDHPLVDEVIVVSDGSSDGTAHLARQAGARVVELPENMGKGAAMQTGLSITSSDVVLFLDADLIGLNHEHVDRMLRPVLDGEVQMTVGVFEGGRGATDFAQQIAPFLSGQRALRRTVLDEIDDMSDSGYGVEVALTRYMRRHHANVAEVILPDLTHRMKEEKRGLVKGFAARMKMYWDIVKLLPKDLPREGRETKDKVR
jgi:glycosyltransferase involved in cell wall biosynthesis